MSGAKWEIHGGIRYPTGCDAVGYSDSDWWIRSPTDPNTVLCGGQEYRVIRDITRKEAEDLRKRWIETNRAEKRVKASIIIQKYARRMLVQDYSRKTVMDLWPEAGQALLRNDFKAAARAFREAYEKSRGWNTDDSVPFTTNQMLLLELILRSELSQDFH
tara:strand:- start:472 stop:951 length:480 start_codon:yes stop_codon:yes gene_type:complete